MSGADEEQVRRLLAAARVQEPVPDDVAARLDDVLAGLVAEQGPRTVVPLARRRRRRALSWAVAAASVAVLGGVGLAQLGGAGSMSADDSAAGDSAAGRAESQVAPEASTDVEGDLEGGIGADEQGEGPGLMGDSPGSRQVPGATALTALEPETLEADVIALRERGADPADRRTLLDRDCVPPSVTRRVELFAVTFGGERGALLLRPVRGGSQVAQVQLCGDPEPAATVVLPAP